MGTEYTEYFDVITDKKEQIPRFFVHQDIHSTLTVSAVKYSDHNIMSTLQALWTWVTLNKFDTHRVASIGFLKYVGIYRSHLTLYSETTRHQCTNASQPQWQRYSSTSNMHPYPFRLHLQQQTPSRRKQKGPHHIWQNHRLPCFLSLHQTCGIRQWKCTNHYSRLWNSMPPRSCYTT